MLYIFARVPGVLDDSDINISASVPIDIAVPFAKEPENTALTK